MRRARLILFFAFAARSLSAQDAVQYTLRFPAPETHYVEVEAVYPAANAQQIEVMMPVWTPGSYLVREYSRNVENVQASTDSGATLPVEKTRKNRWRFPTQRASRVTLRYRVYAREMTVRTNWVDSDFALLNGAPTFIAPIDRLGGSFEVRLELPKSWSRSLTSLDVIEPNHYRAANYDELVDSPIVAGNPAVHEFTVDGKSHYLVNLPDEKFWDGEAATRAVQRIVEQHRATWGVLPYPRYYFFNLIVDASGGLEHKNSTVLMTHRFAMRTRKSLIDWYDLASHEQFHAWNVKRLRPVALGPFDYENENYTTNLWVSEGFTDYYASLDVVRASLMTPAEYLKRLSTSIETLQNTPGRLVQPVAMASYDAWIKFYRPDENTRNTGVDYYTKGALIGWLLDARVRRATNNARSLDDVMRLAYQRYAGSHGFTTEQFFDVVRYVSNADVAAWLNHTVDTAEELDYSDALSWFGLVFRTDHREDSDDHPPRAYLGFTTRVDGGRLVVTQVKRGTPAYDAGVNVDDEIIAIDDFRVAADALDTRLEQYKSGDKAVLTLARRSMLRTIPVTFAAEPENVWKLQRVEKPAPEQAEHFASWIKH